MATTVSVGFVFFVGFVSAQDVTDAALERLSTGRTVRLRLAGTVVDMPAEVYVARVIAGEGEPRAGAAAQQALAITIRTFTAANVGRHRRDGFDLCDTTHCQVLRTATPASRQAAMATAGQLLMYEGRPAEVFYSASCGGRSEAASELWPGANLPYLRSTEDDVHEADAEWVVDVPMTRVEQVLRRAGFEGRRLRDVEVEERSESGRVARLHLAGLRPDEISGDDLRNAVGAREIRSTQFTVKKSGRVLRFSGRGYGHGVGMCVVGAGRRAARGETALAILGQYYPGLQVQSLSGTPLPAPSIEEHEITDAPETTGEDTARTRDELAARTREELALSLGITSVPAIRLEVHESLEAFRRATGRPWWMNMAVQPPVIDLAPAVVLSQSDGVDAFVRRGIAELLMSTALAGRPAWVRVGGARYYGAVVKPAPPIHDVKCPSNAELTMPVSAPAYRVAELRAEACFARALAKTGDWRAVR